ncbi:BppU family phage baseplate upper protein [Listeria monocytogenes]|uniref:BppU family phage baseplate upper protein n=1 Tax=Listeria monocytogenes TaxID=1639 RepID=UPI003F9E9C76
MPFNKEDNMVLKAEARYNPLFDSGIVFYNLDTNNRLGFQMKRKNVIVPLSEINVQSYISLIAQDGSSIVDNLKFENELQGVLSYRIPAEFLKHTGNVHAEVHITTNGKDDTVVMGEFDFEIKDASINKLPADMKINYIRMFDDLKKAIEQKVADIQQAIANGQDYVTAIQNASADAKQTINSAVAGAKADIDAKVTTATTNLNKTATDATKAITDTAKSATDSVDADLKAFKDTVANNGFLKPSDVANYQKYALTGADGVAKRISGADCDTLTELGFYYLPSPINQPSGWGGLYLLVIPGSVANTTAYYKQIGFQYATGKMATRDRKSGAIGDTSLWTDWVVLETEIGSAQKVATLKDLLLKLAPSQESGGVKLSVSSGSDVLTSVENAPVGLYGVYTAGGALNGHPSGRACRGIVLKSDTKIGFIMLVDTSGTIAFNYLNSTAWSGWKTYGSSLLWTGSTVAVKNGVFNLSQSKENFNFLAFVVNLPNANGDQVIYMPAGNSNNMSLEVTNVFDDASGALHYELVLAKTSATRLTVVSEARFNVATGNGVLDNKDFTIKEIWGGN